MKPIALLITSLALLWPGFAYSASSCNIQASSGPAFGVYDPTGANVSSPMDGTGLITIHCNGAADDLSVSLDQGLTPAPGSSCSAPLRQMSSGTSRMRYDLYRDPSRSLVWGCTTASSEHRVLGAGQTVNQFTIYGRIPSGQNPNPGSYVDTIGFTVTF